MKQYHALRQYIDDCIVPQYTQFDPAHQPEHAKSVMDESLALAHHYDVNMDMVLAIAAFHDLGLAAGRATHHLESGRIIRTDPLLPQWFTPTQIETMAQAAEDHRASAKQPPRSIYGMIVAEADRLIDPYTIVRRTVQYGLTHYPTMDKEAQWQRTWAHLQEKYGRNGYLKLWIPESANAARLEAFRQLMAQPDAIRQIYESCYDELNAT